jgi:UDP-N-acetylglucosamine diphosphorylase/glucosamine-1-phosphate N-acetyltransferase
MNICFFNDEKASKFHPLTLTRPLDDLRVGIFTIREKWSRTLGSTFVSRILPDFLEGVFSSGEMDEKKDVIWINSRFLPSEKIVDRIKSLHTGQKLEFKKEVLAARINGEESAKIFDTGNFEGAGLESVEVDEAIHLENLWDLLSLNTFEIEKDIPLTGIVPISEQERGPYAEIHNPENTYLGNNVCIEPGSIIIAEDGPVVIQDGATIEAGSIVKGPVVVGENATVKMAARVYGGTTIGPVCKVGGEVSNCIFHSYSNKGHDGFVGNSIFGQWINLGADTNTSNLKNNYSTVWVTDWNTKKEVETGAQFLGTIMGDHSKTSINTMLNTGTICGVSSNIFMSGFPPKYIPSFSWVGSEEYGEYLFDKAVEAMQAMMKRRDIELTDAYKNMMFYISEKR